MKMWKAMLSLVFAVSTKILFANCSDVISLSKVISTSVQDQKNVEMHANKFCKEYKKHVSQQKSTKFGASYKFLAASFGSSGASEEEIASIYCASDESDERRSDAFEQYTENIAPGAYSAYKSCVELEKRGITFEISPSTILPTQLSLSVSNLSDNGAIAKLLVSSSSDVTCKWKNDNKEIEIQSMTSSILECSRPSYSKKSYVLVINQATGISSKLAISWPQYNDDGISVDVIKNLNDILKRQKKELDDIDNQFKSSVVSFASQCPEGWKRYEPAMGRFIRGVDFNKSVDPDGLREIGSIQDDEIREHDHSLTLRIFGHEYNDRGLPNKSEDNDGAEISKTTSKAGGKETRPKNVSLVYCIKQ